MIKNLYLTKAEYQSCCFWLTFNLMKRQNEDLKKYIHKWRTSTIQLEQKFLFPGPKKYHQGLTLGRVPVLSDILLLLGRKQKVLPIAQGLFMTDKAVGMSHAGRTFLPPQVLPKTALQMPSYGLPFASPVKRRMPGQKEPNQKLALKNL